LNIKTIDHIAINCIDLAKSLDFYGRILGLQHLQVVECGDFDIHYFALPEGARLELFDYHGRNPSASHREDESGLRHITFGVDDVASHEAQIRAEGVEVNLPTCDLPDLGVRVLLFMDPNGVTIEFCERLPEPS
jgi:glyoxylase I family protein